jgi:hypothetical protein
MVVREGGLAQGAGWSRVSFYSDPFWMTGMS